MPLKTLAVLLCCVVAAVLVVIGICVPPARGALGAAAVLVLALGLGIEAAA